MQSKFEFALTPFDEIVRQLQLIWGIIPIKVDNYDTVEIVPELCKKVLKQLGNTETGDKFVITGGVPANYGDVTGGIIAITTRGPSAKYFGSIEGVSSGFYINGAEQVQPYQSQGTERDDVFIDPSYANGNWWEYDSGGHTLVFISGRATDHIDMWKMPPENNAMGKNIHVQCPAAC